MDRVENKSESSDRIALSLGDADRVGATVDPNDKAETQKPIVGWLAVGLGLLGIFFSFIFIPFGFAFSVSAFFVDQKSWGFAGLVLAVLGVLTSATLMTMLGLGTLLAVIGIPL